MSSTPSANKNQLFDEQLTTQVRAMLTEAVEYEVTFAEDLLEQGVSGMSPADMREYLQHVADRRLAQLGIEPLYGSHNPFAFMELQDRTCVGQHVSTPTSARPLTGSSG